MVFSFLKNYIKTKKNSGAAELFCDTNLYKIFILYESVCFKKQTVNIFAEEFQNK